MNYIIYKLAFTAPVHFGNGSLDESALNFCADTLFSALYIEALKLGREDEFYNAVKNEKLLFSDAFPYIKDQYFLPKPMLYVEPREQGDSKQKKQYKKLKYIPAEKLSDYLSGDVNPEDCSLHNLGHTYSQVMAAVRREDDTLPYRVGNYLFNDGNGLYIIVAAENEDVQYLLEDLLDSLSYAGIGGKRNSGKGRFVLRNGAHAGCLLDLLGKKSSRYMLLSSALPQESEMEDALANASYLLQKRSGFVYSPNYAEEQMKKRDLYAMQAGSCFATRFHGDIYDVNEGGAHAVYRYAKGLFLGV
jgi:CRISPR-associated protein Csm4